MFAPHEGPYGFCHQDTAFQLHSLGPGLLKEPARVRERLVNVSVIRKKRQVGHKERARLGPGDGLGVVEHVLHGHAHGVRQTHHHHTQGVSDQNHIHAGGVHQSGEGVIVRGDGRDLAWGVPVFRSSLRI